MEEYVKETLGQYLRREREARHISLEEIPLATRISSPFIRALEENDFDFFSQKEAIPGYLKLYARHLGLDYEDVLRRYTIQSELNNRSKSFQQLPLFLDFASPIKQAEEKKWPPTKRMAAVIGAGVAAVLLVGISLYLYLMPGKEIAQSKTSAPVAGPAPEVPPAAAEPLLPAPAPETAPAAAPPVQLPPTPQVAASQPSVPVKAALPPVEPNVANAREEHAAPAAAPVPTRKKKVIGNSDSKRYHLPGMKYYGKVKAFHRVEFDSEQEAIKAGYYKARE